MEPNTTEERSNGALLGLVIIVVILIIGGIYVWRAKLNQSNPADNNPYTETNSLPGEASDTSSVTNEDSASLEELDKDLQSEDINTNVDVESIE